MNKLQETLKKCQPTGAWLGVKITSVHDRNDFNDTPLHTVCTWGDLEAADILISAGADVNAQGDKGVTPLFNAIISGNDKLVELLLKKGAKNDAKIFGNTSAFDYANHTKANKNILDLLK